VTIDDCSVATIFPLGNVDTMRRLVYDKQNKVKEWNVAEENNHDRHQQEEDEPTRKITATRARTTTANNYIKQQQQQKPIQRGCSKVVS
jgi:hypothetical protein